VITPTNSIVAIKSDNLKETARNLSAKKLIQCSKLRKFVLQIA